MKKNLYKKPNFFAYRFAQAVSWIVAVFFFGRKFLRNELRHAKGPYIVVANHEAALDFVNLIGATRKRLTFVISNSFYSTLPISRLLDALQVIPKQQFQTSVLDMRKMKAVAENNGGLVIYPAGLMCEDGLSTPIPPSTYKFLKWMNVDVYIARTTGTYFAMPKWSKGIRPGKTLLDIYKLYSKEELASSSLDEIKCAVDDALLFDAYHEQEKLRLRYSSHIISGLENVLYQCPHCEEEFSMRIRDKHTIYCTSCGFEETSDRFSLLHNLKGIGKEYRYVSEWSKLIFKKLKQEINDNPLFQLSSPIRIQMINNKKHCFEDAGEGIVTLNRSGFRIKGRIKNEHAELSIPIASLPTLPFGPGKYFEIQHGQTIYRCLPEKGMSVMKYINAVKALYELSHEATV